MIHAATLTTYVVEEQHKTLTKHDIFNKVFQNSSLLDFQTLCKANIVLFTALEGVKGILNILTMRYIHKLADETEWLNTHHIL
jgi:hypothetical protein